jgi:hypothetical protein
VIHPFDNADAWSKLIVAGMVSPGAVKLTGHIREVGWDVKEAAGQDGASTTRKGTPVGKFDATFTLTDDDDFAAWDAFQRLLESSVNGTEPIALDVVHPELQRNHYTAVVLASVGELAVDDRGDGQIKVSFLEYFPPAPKPATGATGSKSNSKSSGGTSGAKGGKDAADSAIDDARKELDDLVKEGESL